MSFFQMSRKCQKTKISAMSLLQKFLQQRFPVKKMMKLIVLKVLCVTFGGFFGLLCHAEDLIRPRPRQQLQKQKNVWTDFFEQET